MQRIKHIGLIVMVLVLASFVAPGFAQQSNQDSKNQQEASQSKDQKKVTGELTNVDREGKTISVKTDKGDEMEFTFNEKTQVQGSETSLERLSGQIGNQVVVTYEDGWMTDTVHRIEIQSGTSQQASSRIGQQAERDSSQSTDPTRSDQNQRRTMDQQNSSQTAQERDQSNRRSDSTLSQQAARDDQNRSQDARNASQSRDDDQAGASASLPQTASSLPEVALFGLLALVGAVTLRRMLA